MDDTTNSQASQSNGRVMITGASRGIGLEFTRAWLARGAQVIATARNPSDSEELQALHREHSDRLRLLQLDVREERSIEILAISLGKTPIDVLINNAGVLQVETLENMDLSSIVEQFRVNALGALQV